MTSVTLLAFCLVALICIATPGPTVLLALANGSRFGVRRAGYGLLGAMLSDVVLVSAAALGLGALLAASEFWFSVVKWIGAAYLAFLGVMLLRSRGRLDASLQSAMQGRGARRAVFLRCFLVAVTNPKGYLFVSALMPQFVSPGLPQWTQYAELGALFVAIDGAVMLAYAMLGSQAVRMLKQSGAQWLDRACGGVLIALAGSLALYRRVAQ